MKDQWNAAINSLLAARREIALLKQGLEAEDAKLRAIEDAELGLGWVIKRLRAEGLPGESNFQPSKSAAR